MNFLLCIFKLTGINLRSISHRKSSTLTALIGVIGTVVVFTGLLSVASGFLSTMENSASDKLMIVFRGFANNEVEGYFSTEEYLLMQQAEGIKITDSGPAMSPETLVWVNVPIKPFGTDANLSLRGVKKQAFEIRGNVNIIEGRMFTPGLNEVIVGKQAAKQFIGLDVGSTHTWGTNTWTIVGIMEANGSITESEVWADAPIMMAAYKRDEYWSTIRIVLDDEVNSRSKLVNWLNTNPSLTTRISSEKEYYSEQSEFFTKLTKTIGIIVGILMALGAIMSALVTAYNAIVSRVREIAVQRALGFSSSTIIGAILLESVVISVIGGIIGLIIAYLLFNGQQVSSVNPQSFSQVAFTFAVTPTLLIIGGLASLIIGLLSAIYPCYYATRISVGQGLRAS